MPELAPGPGWALVIKSGARTCALPLKHVIETMRPLPVEPIDGTPSFVRGVSIIRGTPTPVVDLDSVLGTAATNATRFVTLCLGNGSAEKQPAKLRQVALSVSDVIGVRNLTDLEMPDLPPLLSTAANGAVERIGTLDSGFLVLLRASWELPDEIFRALAARGDN
ncbi:MAG TPA: chemotaxis protein CheW [Blastocatellia bacterium]